MNLSEFHRRALAKQPDKVALIIDENKITFSQLESLADGYARTLAGLGIVSGDRVAFFMGNRLELAVLYLACFRVGAVAVPITWFFKPAETVYVLTHCQAKLLLAEPELYDGVKDMAEQAPFLEKVLIVGGESEDPEASWAQAEVEAAADLLLFDPSPQDPAVILYTSGSTGRPKGVTHTFYSLYHSTLNRCQTLKHTGQDRFFITAYLCHGAALTSVFLTMLYVGGTSVFMRQWSPQDFLDVLRRRRPTVAAAAPMQVQAVLDHPDCQKDDFSSIRYFHVGGDAAPEPLFEKYREKTGLELSVSLGMTECGGYMISPLEGPVKRGSMGKPIAGTEVRLVQENGLDVKAGEIGEVIVKTEALMKGYWNDPENTAATIKDGWLYTGDLSRRDEDGFYYFVGRSKHIIVRDGGNVSPAEVESVMITHPKVKTCGVTGIPDAPHGQAVLAFIVPESQDDRPSEAELTSFAEAVLADRKVPRRYIFVDRIPFTSMSKVDRKVLKVMADEYLTGELT